MDKHKACSNSRNQKGIKRTSEIQSSRYPFYSFRPNEVRISAEAFSGSLVHSVTLRHRLGPTDFTNPTSSHVCDVYSTYGPAERHILQKEISNTESLLLAPIPPFVFVAKGYKPPFVRDSGLALHEA